MRIGIIVASHHEEAPFYDIFGPCGRICIPDRNFGNIPMWRTTRDAEVYLINSGAGEILAAIGTQFLIDTIGVDRIINYGVVGGLSKKHSAEKIGIVEKVVHYDYDISLVDGYVVGQYKGADSPFIEPCLDAIPAKLTNKLNRFVCASADKFVEAGEPKKRLRREFGADICDMESAGVVITCNKNHIPCTLIKAVSDGVDEDEEAFDRNVYSASKKCVKLIAKLIQQI